MSKYVFLDTDIYSTTNNKWSVRDGSVSYDGFDGEADAVEFLAQLVMENEGNHVAD